MNSFRFVVKGVFCIIVLLSAIGCSSTGTMNRIMSSWEGANIDQVTAQWGYPSEQREFRGNTLYIWHYYKSGYIPQSSTTTGTIYDNSFTAHTNTYGGYTIQGACSRILEVDKNGDVVRWEWHGNNCPFAEWMEYSTWRNKQK